MNKPRFLSPAISLSLLLPAVIGLICYSGCGTGTSDKMPITTASEQAREYYITGRDFNERLRFIEARENFRKAVEADSTFALAWLNLAFVSTGTKGFLESIEKAVAYKDQVSEGERLWIEAVEAGMLNNDFREQGKLLQRLVALYPRDERVHGLIGNFYFGQHEWDKAIAEYKTAIKIAPYYSPPYNQLGYAYRYLGKYELAEKAFEEYTQIIPDDPNPYDSYAEFLLKRGKFAQSIASYRKALSFDSSFAASYVGIATGYMLMGDYARARDELMTRFARASDAGQKRDALFALAIMYVDEGRTDSAVAMMEKRYALSAEEGDTAAMANSLAIEGNILAEAGLLNRSRSRFVQALALIQASSLSPQIKLQAQQTRRYSSARLAVAEGNLDQARQLADEYRSYAEKNGAPNQIRQAHELAGIIALAAKEYDRAIQELSQADQQNPYTLYRMGLAYEATGDRVNARLMFSRAAHFNAVYSLPQAFVRRRALQRLEHI